MLVNRYWCRNPSGRGSGPRFQQQQSQAPHCSPSGPHHTAVCPCCARAGSKDSGPYPSSAFPPDKSWISHAEDSTLGTLTEPTQPLISRGGRKPGSHSLSVRWVELELSPALPHHSETENTARWQLSGQETSKSFTTKMNSITPHANCERLRIP